MSNSPPFKPVLLIRPIPHTCESTSEYLQRLAKVNGLRNSKEIAALCGVSFGHISSQSPDMILAVINGRNARQSLSLPPGELPLTRNSEGRVGTSRSSRVCSRCLAESDLLSAKWSLPLSISCEKHKTVLLDRCPNCQSNIQRTDSLYRCRCGLDFRQVHCQPAPLWERSYYELFAPWRTQPDLSFEAFTHFRAETLAGRVTRQLIRAYQPEGQIDTSKYQNGPHWWLRFVDHRFIEMICRDEQILAQTILRLFPAFTNTSQNLYARLTAEATTVQPRALLLVRQLEDRRGITRPRNLKQIREDRKKGLQRFVTLPH
jgi:hypothetical protein